MNNRQIDKYTDRTEYVLILITIYTVLTVMFTFDSSHKTEEKIISHIDSLYQASRHNVYADSLRWEHYKHCGWITKQQAKDAGLYWEPNIQPISEQARQKLIRAKKEDPKWYPWYAGHKHQDTILIQNKNGN